MDVPVKADTAPEAAEHFKLMISGATGGATITDDTGGINIRNDG